MILLDPLSFNRRPDALAVISALIILLTGALVQICPAQVVISEVVASNSTTLEDEDGDASDWIEIHNELADPLDLENFALTDDPDNLAKWQFPSVSIPGKGFLVVFASAKDRKPTDGGELHTNFKLTGAGEFLALVKPDGESLNSVFSPAYPPQRVDIAYGTGTPSSQSTPVATGIDCRWHSPAAADEIDGWTAVDFVDGNWAAGKTGVGYQYPELVGEGSDAKAAMQGKNASVFVRVPFSIANADAVVAVSLRMKFEDGFIAYLNGRQVASFNAPENPTWDSVAIESHSDSDAVEFVNFDVDFSGALVTGTNVLAIQGMNKTSGGSDLLVLPELDVTSQSGDATTGYLVEPTPGKPNGSTVPDLLESPAFSVARGHFTDPFDLELSIAAAAAKIYYTDDGDIPSSESTPYTEPIRVEGTTVIRAIAVRGDEPPSAAETHTFLFIDDVVDQRNLHGSTTKLISESDEYGPLMKGSLLALPAVCLSMDKAKPSGREEAVSIELFDPAGNEAGFQVDAGTKVVGGHSVGSPKNNFRVYFRSEYGTSKFKYPLFEGHPYSPGPTDEFKRLMLRSGSHDTFFWLGNSGNPPAGGRRSDATYLRNRWINDMGLSMGHEALHGRFVQLFINGVYHGQYQVMEFPNDDFHASYLGGVKEDYHFTNGANRGKTGSDHGNGDTWWANWAEVKSRARGDDYAAAAELIDLENLADYMLLSYYSGNTWDWNPTQNWMAGGPKTPGAGGWKFYSWDCDIIFQDVNGNNLGKTVPDGLFADLVRNHEEFRILVRDRIYKHFFNDGVLTERTVRATFDFRANQIVDSIVAETARWQPGGARSRPWDRDGEWRDEWDHYKEVYFPQRTEVVLGQLRKTKVGREILYPIDAPEFSQRGGTVPSNFKPALLTEEGSIYFTTDGSDPRLPGGEINPTAMISAGGVVRTTFIEGKSEWKFLDDGSDQGSAWRARDFDDASWASGKGELGYGDGGEGTVVSFGDNPGSKHVTTYFRKTLSIPVAADVTEMTVGLLRDDGAAVYLNGVEVVRDELPEAASFDTLASSSAGSSEESTYFEFVIQPDMLVDGENVIAVEVHQSSATGSDMSFDLELKGKVLAENSDLVITGDTLVRMRVFNEETWSALNEAFFTLEGSSVASSSDLTVSEIHYNPNSQEKIEFIELRNTSDATVNLSGAQFTDGIGFTFPIGTTLAPQSSLVVVENEEAFRQVYMNSESAWFFEGISVAGEFVGALRNNGEGLALVDREGADIVRFSYNDKGGWPGRPDGGGSSLELRDPAAVPAVLEAKNVWLSDSSNWRPSSEFFGSPGRDGSGPDNRVVINEILASPIEPATDAIELLNTGDTALDISGWFLSDSSTNYKKYALPAGSVLDANAILVVTGDQFDFGLSGSRGDDVTLIESDPAGNFLGFVDRVEFPASAPGESFGRWPDASGNLYPMTQNTLASLNSSNGNTVRIGPVVISEVHYNPDGPDDGREFIVLTNAGTTAQNISTWRMRGEVDYDFGGGFEIEPGASLTLVGFDPADAATLATFREAYGSSPASGFVGPWNTGTALGGKLDDGGGSVRLLRPGILVEENGAEPFLPYYIEDAISWNDSPEWPAAADGGGMTLHRMQPADRGDLAQSWAAGAPFGEVGPIPSLPGYDAWAAEIFPAGTPESNTLSGSDPDGDRTTNSAEFAFATNPLIADAAGATPKVSVSEEHLQIEFRMRESSLLIYTISRSTDLLNWSAIAASDFDIVSTTPVGDGIAAHRTVRLKAALTSSVYYRVAAIP
jgi:hypothetical protein